MGTYGFIIIFYEDGCSIVFLGSFCLIVPYRLSKKFLDIFTWWLCTLLLNYSYPLDSFATAISIEATVGSLISRWASSAAIYWANKISSSWWISSII